MRPTQDALGAFVWYDLFTTDPAAAQEFYGAVAGWTTETWPNGAYTMWMNEGNSIGGVGPLSEQAKANGAPPHWLAYICVADVDASLAKAVGLGAQKLTDPFDVPMVGRIAPMKDPHGAVIALFTPATEAPGFNRGPVVGEFSWHENLSMGWEEAWAFYSELLGWEVTSDMDMGPGGTYRMYTRAGQTDSLGGIMTGPSGIPAWLYYIRVADLDAALATVTARGGRIENGPMEVPGGDRVAQCVDPQGAYFALHATAE